MAESDRSPDAELLSVTLVDVQATLESIRRSLANAQASLELFRHSPSREALKHVAHGLEQLHRECEFLGDAGSVSRRLLRALLEEP